MQGVNHGKVSSNNPRVFGKCMVDWAGRQPGH